MLNIKNLEQTLKEKKLSGLYLFYGKERYLIESNLKRIKNVFGECLKGINYINIDAENIGMLIEDLSIPAFGYSKKLIVAKNTGLFKKEAKKKAPEMANLKKNLDEYIKNNIDEINSSVVLVFIEEEADKTDLFETIDKFRNSNRIWFAKTFRNKRKTFSNLQSI